MHRNQAFHPIPHMHVKECSVFLKSRATHAQESQVGPKRPGSGREVNVPVGYSQKHLLPFGDCCRILPFFLPGSSTRLARYLPPQQCVCARGQLGEREPQMLQRRETDSSQSGATSSQSEPESSQWGGTSSVRGARALRGVSHSL